MVPSIEDVGTMLGSQMKVRMNIAPAKSTTILREKTRHCPSPRNSLGQSCTMPHLRGEAIVIQRLTGGNRGEALGQGAGGSTQKTHSKGF
jgi:hypothetical protein